jgi:hypothetical protein
MNDSEDVEGLEFLRSTVRLGAKSLSSIVKRKNRQYKTLEKWREDQIARFLRIFAETSSDIATAYRRNRAATVAWLTRNLLELSIWIEYCTSTEENALSFRNDAFKDLYGIARAWDQLDLLNSRRARDLLLENVDQLFDPTEAKEQVDSIIEEFERIVSELSDAEAFLTDDQVSTMAEATGVVTLRDNHLNVAEVARSIGRGDAFTKQNRFLSKLAHPTALLAHMPTGDDYSAMEIFITDATLLAAECMLLLSAFVTEIFPKEVKL